MSVIIWGMCVEIVSGWGGDIQCREAGGSAVFSPTACSLTTKNKWYPKVANKVCAKSIEFHRLCVNQGGQGQDGYT